MIDLPYYIAAFVISAILAVIVILIFLGLKK